MKEVVYRIFAIFILSLVCSCWGKIEKEWLIDDFSKPKRLEIDIPTDKNVSNVNIYLKGDFKDTIYLGRTEKDTVFEYSSRELPKDKIFMDFYGGKFELYIHPSNAEGNLSVIIEVPYDKSLF